MILVDANLLLYAYDPDCEQHDASRQWLEHGATLHTTDRDFTRFPGLDCTTPG